MRCELTIPTDMTHTKPIPEHPIAVVGLADEDDCMADAMVTVEIASEQLAVPFAQLKCLSEEEYTRQAVEDWHYWVGRGYQY